MKRIKPRLSKLPPVWITYDVESKAWILLDDYRVLLRIPNHKDEDFYSAIGFLTIPGGFEFDLSSIPPIFRSIIERHDLSIVAPLVHDYLYDFGGLVFLENRDTGNNEKVKLTRLEADQIFLELMHAEGVPRLRRWLAFKAVRMFGGFSWNKLSSSLK